MQRIIIALLALAGLAFAAPPTADSASVSANLAIGVTQSQTITGITLSNNSFTGGAASGTVVGTIAVTMAPASPAFSGALSLSGTNAASFQIVGTNLETNGVVPAGSYSLMIVANQPGATGSPFTQAETITATAASASTCPTNDGSSGASPGSPQYPNLLNAYTVTIHKLGCKVAGVDYRVGLADAQSLQDPAAGGLPAGCTYNASSHVVACSGGNITIRGWDFSLHNGLQLSMSGSGNVISGNNFGVGSNCLSPINLLGGAGSTSITYNTLDGGGSSCASSDLSPSGGLIVANFSAGSTITVEWNWLKNIPEDASQNRGPASGSTTLVWKYNLIDLQGWTGHPDGIQLNGGNFSNLVFSNNTYRQTIFSGQTQGVQPIHIEAQLTSAISNPIVSYNTVISSGSCNGGKNYPTGCSVNYDIACKLDSGSNSNTGFSAYANYVDASGAVAALTNAYNCTNATFGSPYPNFRMDTGHACVGTTCN